MRTHHENKKNNKRTSRRPPWEHKKWKHGVIRRPLLQIFGPSALLWILSLYFGINGIFFIKIETFRPPWTYDILLLLLPVASLFCCYFGFMTSLKAWRFRECEFRMETIPGVIGGKMRGQFVFPENLLFVKNLYVQLTNIEDVSYEDNEPDLPPLGEQHCLYSHTTIIDAHKLKFIDGKCLVAVEFTIPYDTKDETDSHEIPDSRMWHNWHYKYWWNLRVYTDTCKKRNFVLSFLVPIFRTKDSDPSIIRPAKSEYRSNDCIFEVEKSNIYIKLLFKIIVKWGVIINLIIFCIWIYKGLISPPTSVLGWIGLVGLLLIGMFIGVFIGKDHGLKSESCAK